MNILEVITSGYASAANGDGQYIESFLKENPKLFFVELCKLLPQLLQNPDHVNYCNFCLILIKNILKVTKNHNHLYFDNFFFNTEPVIDYDFIASFTRILIQLLSHERSSIASLSSVIISTIAFLFKGKSNEIFDLMLSDLSDGIMIGLLEVVRICFKNEYITTSYKSYINLKKRFHQLISNVMSSDIHLSIKSRALRCAIRITGKPDLRSSKNILNCVIMTLNQQEQSSSEYSIFLKHSLKYSMHLIKISGRDCPLFDGDCPNIIEFYAKIIQYYDDFNVNRCFIKLIKEIYRYEGSDTIPKALDIVINYLIGVILSGNYKESRCVPDNKNQWSALKTICLLFETEEFQGQIFSYLMAAYENLQNNSDLYVLLCIVQVIYKLPRSENTVEVINKFILNNITGIWQFAKQDQNLGVQDASVDVIKSLLTNLNVYSETELLAFLLEHFIQDIDNILTSSQNPDIFISFCGLVDKIILIVDRHADLREYFNHLYRIVPKAHKNQLVEDTFNGYQRSKKRDVLSSLYYTTSRLYDSLSIHHVPETDISASFNEFANKFGDALKIDFALAEDYAIVFTAFRNQHTYKACSHIADKIVNIMFEYISGQFSGKFLEILSDQISIEVFRDGRLIGPCDTAINNVMNTDIEKSTVVSRLGKIICHSLEFVYGDSASFNADIEQLIVKNCEILLKLLDESSDIEHFILCFDTYSSFIPFIKDSQTVFEMFFKDIGIISIYLSNYSMVSLFEKRFDSFVRIYCRYFRNIIIPFQRLEPSEKPIILSEAFQEPFFNLSKRISLKIKNIPSHSAKKKKIKNIVIEYSKLINIIIHCNMNTLRTDQFNIKLNKREVTDIIGCLCNVDHEFYTRLKRDFDRI